MLKKKNLQTVVFVHIPKTAGSSLRQGVRQAKPKHTILFDYRPDGRATTKEYVDKFDNPDGRNELAEEFAEKPLFLCGHFRAEKYVPHFPLSTFAAFFRDPVERVLSNYNQRLRRGFEYTLEEYLNLTDHHNVQSKFVIGVNWREFGFIGLTDEYDESLKRFREFSGIKVKALKRNVRARPFAPPSPDMVAQIKAVNMDDIELYRQVKDHCQKKWPPF